MVRTSFDGAGHERIADQLGELVDLVLMSVAFVGAVVGIVVLTICLLFVFAVQYGKIEAHIKIPRGQGMWPAFWMLGGNDSEVGWPKCGEIDAMENIGKEASVVHGTVHGPGYSGKGGISSQHQLPGAPALADDFHIYGVEWSPESINFFIDGISYGAVTPASLPKGAAWVYDHPFFLILNVAVGGGWPGNPDETTIFPQTMLVDWVRVSKRAD